ncbi:hypothetical protein N7490_002033 [Penicillium lividum]|nr:hypothetical protein N7490_002033 [Penicillium lividum]
MNSPAQSLRGQWKEPTDIFTVLLIIGGDIIQQALAAVSGGYLTPVAFSFGWVAYAMSTLLSATGEVCLMPESPVGNLQVVNLETGYRRLNRSWTLGRLFLSYEAWMPNEVQRKLEAPMIPPSDDEKASVDPQPHVALCVAVFHWSSTAKGREAMARPGHDWVWWTGIFVSGIQIGISTIPFAIYNDWQIFLVTFSGTVLAYCHGTLSQWKREKWPCRRNVSKPVALTLGNGSKHVMIVCGKVPGLDLEDMAGGNVYPKTSRRQNWIYWLFDQKRATRVLLGVFAVLWLGLLITSQGIQTHTWYLVSVGGLGMIQNLVVARATRFPDMLGIPIKLKAGTKDQPAVFAESKVMWTLMELEMAYEGFGRALLNEFFGTRLKDWEAKWWNEKGNENRRKALSDKKRCYLGTYGRNELSQLGNP